MMSSRPAPFATPYLPSGLALAAALMLGCFGNETTAFPEGLEPLEEATVELPDPVDGQPYPEELRTATGSLPMYGWVHARGYVHAPLADVFAAMRTPEACVDRNQVDRWTVTPDVEPEYDYSFRIHNEVDDIITVEFDITWRLGRVEGTEAAPTLVAGTWQKTWGTTFISLLRGSIVGRRVTDDVSEVEIVEHIRAATGGVDPAEAYVRDLYANIVALSHGEPLPP